MESKQLIHTKKCSILIIILVFIGLLAGCMQPPPLTEIQPSITVLGEGWSIQNTTHAYDYSASMKGEALLGLTVNEYLLVKYIGDRQACNFFAVRTSDTQKGQIVLNRYIEKAVEYGREIESDTLIGDKSILIETSFSGISGYMFGFRIENIVIAIACFTVEKTWIEEIAEKVFLDIQETFKL